VVIRNLSLKCEIRYLKLQPSPEKQYGMVYETVAKWADRRGRASCGIIYARVRKTCDELAAFLQERGISARPYHRGLGSSQLDTTLEAWTEGDGCDIVVATVCFGMGIDKANVRYSSLIQHHFQMMIDGNGLGGSYTTISHFRSSRSYLADAYHSLTVSPASPQRLLPRDWLSYLTVPVLTNLLTSHYQAELAGTARSLFAFSWALQLMSFELAV
jgi:hypothetical protein